ncbi:MAG: GNAT family N-acetyltransferase [Frankiales bacterium]|nr:GNAT family N-acetyltransferase [Frankiales bacterium]
MTGRPADQKWTIRRLDTAEVDVVGRDLGLARLHQGDGFYLVAWEDTRPVGHCHLALSDPPELQDVEVAPRDRRRGVASALVAAAEAEARARGAAELRLELSVDDPVASALYRSRGYADAGLPHRRVTGTIHIRTGPIEVDDTLVTWTKRLRV